eukprot:scaffold5816_cov267-Pinguiococcus_pyrenoidosus.AAC.10
MPSADWLQATRWLADLPTSKAGLSSSQLALNQWEDRCLARRARDVWIPTNQVADIRIVAPSRLAKPEALRNSPVMLWIACAIAMSRQLYGWAASLGHAIGLFSEDMARDIKYARFEPLARVAGSYSVRSRADESNR